MKEAWFRNDPSHRGLARAAKPVTWQVRGVQAGAVMLFLMLLQALARWAAMGFQPVAAGFWPAAGVFMLIALYLKVVKRFSDASGPDQERG